LQGGFFNCTPKGSSFFFFPTTPGGGPWGGGHLGSSRRPPKRPPTVGGPRGPGGGRPKPARPRRGTDGEPHRPRSGGRGVTPTGFRGPRGGKKKPKPHRFGGGGGEKKPGGWPLKNQPSRGKPQVLGTEEAAKTLSHKNKRGPPKKNRPPTVINFGTPLDLAAKDISGPKGGHGWVGGFHGAGGAENKGFSGGPAKTTGPGPAHQIQGGRAGGGGGRVGQPGGEFCAPPWGKTGKAPGTTRGTGGGD